MISVYLSCTITLGSIGHNPVDKVWDFSVNTRIVGSGTTIAPRHNTSKVGRASVRAGKGSTRVTLARVLSSLTHSSTQHGVLNVILAISVTTSLIRHDGNGNLHENVRWITALSGSTPARHNTVTRSGMTSSRKGNGLYVVVEGERLWYLQQGDVVGEDEGVVVFMLNDFGQDNLLFIAVIYWPVVFTSNNLCVEINVYVSIFLYKYLHIVI